MIVNPLLFLKPLVKLMLRWCNVSQLSLQNDVSEKEQRWGAKTVQGSGHQEHIK